MKIIGSCHRTLTMCGGLSQVFGRFAAEGWFGERLPLEVREPLSTFTLETEAGLVPIEVSIKGGKVTQVTTRMNCFVDELYRDGVHPLNLLGVRAYRVGKVLVVNADEVQRMSPVADVAQLDEKARTALIDLQDRFLSDNCIRGEKSVEDFALYDLHPERGGDARIVFPHNLRAMYVEPSCGTGSVAAAIAVCEDAGLTDRTMEISFESGGLLSLGGPEITHVRLVARQGRIREASFHHSVVEPIAEGRVWISVGQ